MHTVISMAGRLLTQCRTSFDEFSFTSSSRSERLVAEAAQSDAEADRQVDRQVGLLTTNSLPDQIQAVAAHDYIKIDRRRAFRQQLRHIVNTHRAISSLACRSQRRHTACPRGITTCVAFKHRMALPASAAAAASQTPTMLLLVFTLRQDRCRPTPDAELDLAAEFIVATAAAAAVCLAQYSCGWLISDCVSHCPHPNNEDRVRRLESVHIVDSDAMLLPTARS